MKNLRAFCHLKSFSWFLLLVMLTVTLNCVHESAHAMQYHVSAACDHSGDTDAAQQHQDSPADQHHDNDCCENCSNCASHAPLTLQPLQLGYNPVLTDLHLVEPFQFLPEVYLSKFVPPQIPA